MAVTRFPIEASHVMMFARAIGETNPVYFDEEYARSTEVGAIIAPPTFVQASAQFDPDALLRPKPGQPWFGSGREPTGMPGGAGPAGGAGGLARGLHAEQHYEYHRPLKVGDVLSARVREGARWEKQGRSGRLLFFETITEYVDAVGEVVVTARSVGVTTEGPRKGAGR